MTQFCKRGHDTLICGRQSNRSCKLCNRLSILKYRMAHADKYKEYTRNYHKVYAQTHKEEFRLRAKQFRNKRRIKCFEKLGNQCVCCGETQIKFLQVDHINGGGRKEKLLKSGYSFRRIELENYPKEKYQVLCSNCNWAKGIYGVCPHKEN